MAKRIRKHIDLKGVLQGIGCRPTIYRLAKSVDLGGWVINTPDGVMVEIEGPSERCDLFLDKLPSAIPFPGRIDLMEQRDIQELGERDFTIKSSLQGPRESTPIPPDVAVCPECVKELLDPSDDRHLYPFITCTLCGPRFTVVRSFPYDRERTSMADFTMCARCKEEYETPEDRRFHSQTNSCPQCGPKLWLADRTGTEFLGDPILGAIQLLGEGKILAIKGIGGFHLACDATNPEAVQLLRDRKGRIGKPFALMAADLPAIRKYCLVDEDEEELIGSPVAPIVLLEGKKRILPENVAPDVGTLGFMLPYSPIHHLLFHYPGVKEGDRLEVLVMTSGNRSEEPIAKDNAEALEGLWDLADAFVLHNREITLRADDSIFRVIHGRKTVFRRSRGIVPAEFTLKGSRESVKASENVTLAAGGDLKNCMVIVKGDRAVPGPHVGDLASPVAQEYFEKSMEILTEYLEAKPDLVAVDPHPEYFSTSMARELSIPVIEVYHHHAHAVSLLAEHGEEGPILCAAFDGTGFGEDASIWGGEFLIADRKEFHRVASLSPFHLPGGEAAIRFPLRILAALLANPQTWELNETYKALFKEHVENTPLWLETIKRNFNAPLTSSAGRLFDAAAAAIGFSERVTFEGQAAMWLEAMADTEETGQYHMGDIMADQTLPDSRVLISKTAQDILDGTPPGIVAARFHNTLAELVSLTLSRLAIEHGVRTIGLSGGCFQNKLFTERAAQGLENRGFKPLLHEKSPPNDGGIALGQAIVARNLMGKQN